VSGDLEIPDGPSIPAEEIQEAASRSSGPGGQHVNKSNTRVTLRWSIRDSAALSDDLRERLLRRLSPRLTNAGELIVHADESRSRMRNREYARQRMLELVSEALEVPRVRRPTRASRASKERALAEKARRGRIKKNRARVVRNDD